MHESTFDIYEILFIEEPSIIFLENGIYPTLTASGLEPALGYNSVKIVYPSSSVQKLYSFDQTNWEQYNDNQEIQIQYNQTLYAKGINSEGEETRNRTIYRDS